MELIRETFEPLIISFQKKYTGISFNYFDDQNRQLKQTGVEIGCFITLNRNDTVGPWDIAENMPTLEEHRYETLEEQVNRLSTYEFIDSIIVSTQFVNENEMKQISTFNTHARAFKILVDKNITKVERDIVFFTDHLVRGTKEDILIRSMTSRMVFKGIKIEPRKNEDDIFKKGTVVISNIKYGERYENELEIILKDIKNDDRKNVVGFVKDIDKYINYMNEFKPFYFYSD